jgi:hypothetical protein
MAIHKRFHKQLILAGLVAGWAALAQAAPFSYDYVEGGFGETDSNDTVFAGISKSLDKNIYVLGNFYNVDLDRGHVNYLEGGVGYRQPIDNRTSFFVNGQLLYANASRRAGDSDDFGAIARAGVRFMAAPQLELEGSLALSSNDLLVDDGLGLSASARYLFTPRFSAAIGYSADTELDGAFVSARYNLD